MLGKCEKMAVAATPATTTNQWPQSAEIDEHKVSNSSRMEKPGQELLLQQQALKCPRCDSSNTKFCYYNNYSLSQPRHFCKACKRYWTRGGTLRNVPVGGGCRKNKRVRRPTTLDSSPSPSPSSAPTPSVATASQSQPRIDAASTSNHHPISPLFYGLASNPCDVNHPFSRFNSSSGGFGQLNALGLGFSSGVMSIEEASDNGFTSNNNTNTLLSSYGSSFFGSSSSHPVIVPNSLLGSTLMMQQKLMNGGVKDGAAGGIGSTSFQGSVAPLDDHGGGEADAGMVVALKDVKVELGHNRLGLWDNGQMSMSDPNSLYWNPTTSLGAWNDQPNNIGPSVTSLI